ncbi:MULTISPECIES: DUF397 domain-containing protein [unclassified Streptomyces]|uniref:DUF397 domain-containing protein n=2 Tax=unclassified Streptomyces TaxID=2593676 RepID=UPI003815169B
MGQVDMAELAWIKSGHSNAQSACAEAALGANDGVPVRDSKAAHGPVLLFGTAPWSAFVAGVKQGANGKGCDAAERAALS